MFELKFILSFLNEVHLADELFGFDCYYTVLLNNAVRGTNLR